MKLILSFIIFILFSFWMVVLIGAGVSIGIKNFIKDLPKGEKKNESI